MARWGDRKKRKRPDYETSPPPKGPLMASIPIPIPDVTVRRGTPMPISEGFVLGQIADFNRDGTP
jgi:hypothetical protein